MDREHDGVQAIRKRRGCLMLTAEDYTAVLIPTMPFKRLKIGDYTHRAEKYKLFKGEHIASAANDANDLYYYYVEKGQLRCLYTKINGEPVTQFYRNEGNAFSVEYQGISSLGHYTMRYVATRDTVVCGFTQKQLYEIIAEDPEIFYEYILVCHMAFGQMGHRISDAAVPSAMERLIMWLRKLCIVHTPGSDGVYTIESNLTIQQLAELLFIHETTCSRLISTLETEHVIKRTRTRIWVLDYDRLVDFEVLD